MVSKNVEIVLKTLKTDPNLMKDLNNALQKIFDAAEVHLSDEETAELFHIMTESIIIVDSRKDLIIVETKPTPQETYQKDMEKRRKEGTLDFEMWLRHVKNVTGQTIFQLNIDPDPIRQRELEEEYARWKGEKRNL